MQRSVGWLTIGPGLLLSLVFVWTGSCRLSPNTVDGQEPLTSPSPCQPDCNRSIC